MSGPPTQPTAAELRRAADALRDGDAQGAASLVVQATQADPADAAAWLLLARCRLALGRPEEALAAADRAVALRPGDADGHAARAEALAALGRPAEAADCLRQALARDSGHAGAHARLGLLLAEQGLVADALPHLARAAELSPGSAPAAHNLGVALAQAGRAAEAAARLGEALRLDPGYAEACYNLGTVLKDLGRADEAVARLRQAVRLRPDHAGAYNNLGLLLTEASRAEEAVIFLGQACRLRPRMKEAHNNLGLAHARLGRFAEAQACFHEALRLDPGYAEAHTNLASNHKEKGELDAALACYDVALAIDPQSASARYNRALALLQRGDWTEGWREYEWRWRRDPAPGRTFARPRWDGSPLEGRTVLLWSEQGLGDTLQFARYAALVAARGGRVLLECPGLLAPLLTNCPGVERVVAEGEPPPAYDVQAPLLSLPGLLGTTPDTVPAEVPYLAAEPERVERWRGRLPCGGLRVGICWQGNRHFQWDHWRSAPLAAFAPLAAVDGVTLVSLQKGHGAEQLRTPLGWHVHDLGDDFDAEGGFRDAAAVLRSLDLVVSVDTALGHLAGALGVPVWLALAAVSDWRWLTGREDTPWYPTMRLFRQEKLGDWAGGFARMAAALARLAGGAKKGRSVRVALSPGELFDRLSIARLKLARITNEAKLAHVRAELAELERAAAGLRLDGQAAALLDELGGVNGRLWEVEDALRRCERDGDFGPRFVELARSVYRLNDERGGLKRRLGAALGAAWFDQKQYG